MSKILHVTDAFNGGVFEVILELVRQFPEHDYIILYRAHSWDPTSNITQFFFEQHVRMVEWNKSSIKKYTQLNSLISIEKPDLVHLHSTLAGVIGRLIPNSKKFSLYSPHAFSFQKLDIPILLRKILYTFEKILQKKTLANVAFWPIETNLFKQLAPSSETIYAPVMIEKQRKRISPKKSSNENLVRSTSLQVVSIGRLAPQKDPEFFIQVIENLRKHLIVDAIWYGDGTQFSLDRLSNKGIKISGWLDPDQIFTQISRNRSIAVFTSHWESGPITLFETLSVEVPVVCRSIEAFDCYGLGDGETPEALSNKILMLNSEPNLNLIAVNQRKLLESKLPKPETLKLHSLYNGDSH